MTIKGVDKKSATGNVVQIVAPAAAIKVDKSVEGGVQKEAAPTTPNSDKAPVGRLHRTMGVSVKTDSTVPLPTAQPEVVAEPLTLEGLTEHWEAMLEAMRTELPKLADQLKGKELRLEGEDDFVIVVNNSYAEAEIRPHLIRMLTFLRKRSHRPMLNCKVEVVYEEHESVAYTARDKYDVMVQANPMLENFRILFPEVDL